MSEASASSQNASKDVLSWVVYIIECANGKLYTGITQDIDRRIQEHTRKGSHFTSYNSFKKLLRLEFYPTRTNAETRETQIKRWSHAKKMALVKGDMGLLRGLSKSRKKVNELT